jgi:peptide/nickel transport system substrate-binding protein
MKAQLCFCFFLSSLGLSNTPPPKDILVVGISQEYDSLHPHMGAMAAARYVHFMMNRTLVTMDADLKWVPVLATEIPSSNSVKKIIENGVAKSKVTWNIKKNAKWSDGIGITCADFQFSLKVGKSPLVQVANKEIFEKIDRIEFNKKSPQSCHFIYANDSWSYYQIPEFFPLPSHLDEVIYDTNLSVKDGYSTQNIYSLGKVLSAAFSGPYKVLEVKPGSHLILEKNPHFYGQPPYFSKIVIKIIPHTNTFEAHLKSKNLDMIAPIGITLDQALDFEKRWATQNDQTHTVIFKEGTLFEHLSFSLDSPILKDINVRQALVLSINRQDLTRHFFEGKQSPAEFYHPRVCPWFPSSQEGIKKYPFSVKKAEELLENSGWKKKEDGFRYKDSQKLTFTFSTTAGNTIRQNVQAYMVNEWKKIGVDVLIKNYPARVLFGEVAKKRQFDGVIMHAWPVAPETTPVGFLSSNNIPTEKNNWSGFNFGGWNSPQWDNLNELLMKEKSQTKRKAILKKMLNVYNTELPDFPLYYRTEVAVIPKALKNFRINGHNYFETNQIENWMY